MKFQINHKSNVPLHFQVEELLRKMLEAPEFKNGAFFPKEVQLANRLGVSRNTVRQATNKLQNEGLIIRKKGVGTRTANKKPLATGLDHWYSFTQEMKEKGVHVLAKAFAHMPDYKIIIAGDGPERKLLQEEFSSYSNVYFTGHVEKKQVTEYMKKCKALICPSIWYEGAPLTIIEAFATGTPVIASRLGSMAESIVDGFNGLHFTTGDADDLHKKIELFTKETEQHSMFYKNARQTYLEKYHEDIHYNSILKIYEKVIAEKND